MLIETAVVGLLVTPMMIIGKVIARWLNQTGWRMVPFQMAVTGLMAFSIAHVTGLVPYIIAMATFTPLIINVGSVGYNRLQKWRALNGAYGSETQWAAELVDEGNPEFAFAVQQLPQSELRTLGIIADSKKELHELTIERFDELADDSVPEDFAR